MVRVAWRGRGRGRRGSSVEGNPRQTVPVVPAVVHSVTPPRYLPVNIFHGGKFVTHPRSEYIDGECEKLETCDIDTLNSIVLNCIAKGLGYSSFKVWYLQPGFGLQNGLRPFVDDADVLRFLNEHSGSDIVNFYIEKLTDVPGSLDNLVIDDDVVYDEVEIVSCSVAQPSYLEPECDAQPISHLPPEPEPQSEPEAEHVQVDGEPVVVEVEPVPAQPEAEPVPVDVEPVPVDADPVPSSEDEDYIGNSDDEDDSEVSLDDSDYEEGYDWSQVLPVNYKAPPAVCPSKVVSFFEDENENESSEDLESPYDSDEDCEKLRRRKFPKFKVGGESSVIKFEVGHVFTDPNLFGDAVRDYALQNRKDIVFKKNEPKRIVIKWMILDNIAMTGRYQTV